MPSAQERREDELDLLGLAEDDRLDVREQASRELRVPIDPRLDVQKQLPAVTSRAVRES